MVRPVHVEEVRFDDEESELAEHKLCVDVDAEVDTGEEEDEGQME